MLGCRDSDNIPIIAIKMISDNILTGENYKREVGIELQKVIMKYLEQLLKDTNRYLFNIKNEFLIRTRIFLNGVPLGI